ncbi:MAG TPA: hypothetical protein DCM87_11305 [Planctomycetes bacterium]|nr:hypothetical protein [Planctomycetota bacterium]
MEQAARLLAGLLPAAYAIVLCLYAGLLAFDGSAALKKTAFRALAALAVLHFLALGCRGAALDRCPLIGGFELVSFLAFAMIVIHLIVERLTGYQTPGIAALGLALVLQTIASSLWGYEPGADPRLRPWAVHLHASLGIGGHAGFLTGATYSLLYLALYAQIKAHRLGRLWERLPPLETMQRMSVWALGLGVCSLTCAIAIGLVRAWRDGLSPQPLWTSGVSWLLFGALLGVGRRLPLSGMRFAAAAVCAAVVDLGLLVFTEFLHKRHLGL